jgi:hypothetical protein
MYDVRGTQRKRFKGPATQKKEAKTPIDSSKNNTNGEKESHKKAQQQTKTRQWGYD